MAQGSGKLPDTIVLPRPHLTVPAYACVCCCAAGSKLKPAGLQVAGSTAPFTVGLSPQAAAEREEWLAEERTRQEAFQQAETAKLRREIEDQLRLELHGALAKKQGFSWRDTFCCCFPRRKVSRLFGCGGVQHPQGLVLTALSTDRVGLLAVCHCCCWLQPQVRMDADVAMANMQDASTSQLLSTATLPL